MIFEFLPAANDELLEALEYYEQAVSGLGNRFFLAVRETMDQIAAHPESGSKRGRNSRHIIVRGFPDDIVYESHVDAISILVIAHQHRRPDFWKNRNR